MLGQRFNKACDSCHISKVRCVPDPLSPIGTCKRCTKNGTQCIFSPVGPRRRPMRTKNERIAELERRVKDMQLKLEKQVEKRAGAAAPTVSPTKPHHDPASCVDLTGVESGLASASDPDFDPASSSVSVSVSGPDPGSTTGLASRSSPHDELLINGPHRQHEVIDESRIALATQVPLPKRYHPQPNAATSTMSSSPDVLEQGLLTATQAERLVREFRAKLHGRYLGICLPDRLTGEQLRRKRPAFWLSVLCAASASSQEFLSLAPTLFGELKKILDERIVDSAEPDLDALQAFINYVTFHYDPVFPLGEQLLGNYRTAVAMVVQMAEASRIHNLPHDAPIAEEDVTDEDIQLSRELLHWYWASFSLTMKSRKSSMLRKTHLVEASLRVLQIAGTQQDLFLTEWIKMARIGADTAVALHQGHTQASAGLSDEARDRILDTFEKRRKQWLVECPFDLVNETLMLEFHYHVLLISEVVYPAGVADFGRRSQGLPPISPRTPSTTATATTSSTTFTNTTADSKPDQNFLAPYKIRYTRKCITAAHACLDIMTNPADRTSGYARDFNLVDASDDLLQRFSALPYGRIFYALRFLLFVAHEIWETGQYDLVDVASLRIGSYIAALKRCLKAASAEGKYRTPSLWVYALRTRIEPWYRDLCALLEKARSSDSATPGDEVGPGEMTPRATPPAPTAPAPRSSPATDTDTTSSTKKATMSTQLADASVGGEFFSPLLFDFPFEVLSRSGTMQGRPMARSSNPGKPHGSNTTAPLDATTANTASAQLPSSSTRWTAGSTSPSSIFLKESSGVPATPVQQYMHAADPAPTIDLSSGLNLGDLSASFDHMDLYPLDFNWGDSGDVFLGSDMFRSTFPPLNETGVLRDIGSPLHIQGHRGNGTRE